MRGGDLAAWECASPLWIDNDEEDVLRFRAGQVLASGCLGLNPDSATSG